METLDLLYILNPSQRLWWPYLLSALGMAGIFLLLAPRYAHLLLGRHVWWHPSARLDYGYFVVVGLIKATLIVWMLPDAAAIAAKVIAFLHTHLGRQQPLAWPKEVIVALYTVAIFAVSDLSRYWLHRWMHTVPFLWRFHRVHHSARVLNPLTFYRVHPVENLLFGLRYALVAGVVTGGFIYLFGARLGVAQIAGVNLLVFISAFAGANLRHSHLPIRFGKAERWLVSPAMHQFHHTKEGARTNYGGTLALWDRVFGSLVIPDHKIRRFGLGKALHTSLAALLFEPLKMKGTSR